MISIVIPVYNQAEKLSRCLDSILGQTILAPSFPRKRESRNITAGENSALAESLDPRFHGDDESSAEVIVVNDGSTDNIERVVKKYENKFANFIFINQENKGSNPARNRGFKELKGEYILFCDADIEMKPEMLEVMLSALEKNPQASYVYSSFKYGFKTFKLWPFDAGKLKKMPYIHTTSLIRREHFPGFDEKIKRLQDWDLWLTMLEQGHTGVWINKILFKARGGGTISSWLPSFAYKLFPFFKSVKKYKEAEEMIRKKHNLIVIARSSPRATKQSR